MGIGEQLDIIIGLLREEKARGEARQAQVDELVALVTPLLTQYVQVSYKEVGKIVDGVMRRKP